MNKSKINSFLSSSGNRKLVLGVAMVLSIAGVARCAEAYYEQRLKRTKAEGLHSQVDALELLVDENQSTLEALNESITLLQQKTVNVTGTKGFRDQLVEVVRAAGCQLRSLTLDDRESRRWKEGDDPASEAGRIVNSSNAMPTPYKLHFQRLALVSSGRFKNVKTLLQEIQGVDRFLHTRSLDIKVDANGDLTVGWELTIFDLTWSPGDLDD